MTIKFDFIGHAGITVLFNVHLQNAGSILSLIDLYVIELNLNYRSSFLPLYNGDCASQAPLRRKRLSKLMVDKFHGQSPPVEETNLVI